ncbi:hypothetical protein [Amycolatopsis sp. NPDC059657]|uniref:hypothetical protein n=1 Tax=Amycolatopsis sp. NPDC059657 TaxID=3346899 RepID=UPI00366B9EBB
MGFTRWRTLCAATAVLVAGLTPPASAATFVDEFDSLNTGVWACEYSCPAVADGVARFNLKPGAAPNTAGSWSKIRYKTKRFTSAKVVTRFALSARPTQAVWWGTAFWSDGPAADGSQFNEVNFGYTTSQSFTNSQLRFESAKRGKYVSLKVDTGVNLYDGKYHTATLEYTSSYVKLYFDGKLLQTITDTSVIPTDAMDLVVGPRLVTGSSPLNTTFTQTVGSVEIS